jgi:hypothetical protein
MAFESPFHRFERSLPSRGREPLPRALGRLGLAAALGGERRLAGTPFDPPAAAR